MSDLTDETGTPPGDDSPAGEAAENAEPEPEPQAAPAPGGEEPLRTLDELISDDLAALVAERDDYLDSLRRLQADFDNYRKRSARQQSELSDRATEGLIVALLPVLDALDLAAAHLSEEAAPSLEQIGSLLRSTLEREGLERIDAVEVEFDPTVHDAVAHEPSDEHAGQPVIVEVMRAGYRLKGKVLRPAMVRVKG